MTDASTTSQKQIDVTTPRYFGAVRRLRQPAREHRTARRRQARWCGLSPTYQL